MTDLLKTDDSSVTVALSPLGEPANAVSWLSGDVLHADNTSLVHWQFGITSTLFHS